MKPEGGAPKLIDPLRLAPNDERDMRVHVEELGDISVLVVDNFYRDPQYVRSLALSLAYSRRRGLYPGYEAVVSLDTGPLSSALSSFIEEGCELVAAHRNTLTFSIAAPEDFPPRVSLQQPHVDNVSNDGVGLAAIIYLNLPHQCRGGTALYTHRRTGQAVMPQTDSEGFAELMANFGFTSPAQVRDLFYGRGPSTDLPPREYFRRLDEEWKQTYLVEMKFNRLAIYPSQAFHSGAGEPGDFGLYVEGAVAVPLPERRLTQNLLLESFGG